MAKAFGFAPWGASRPAPLLRRVAPVHTTPGGHLLQRAFAADGGTMTASGRRALAPIRPSAAQRDKYDAKLARLLRDMHADLVTGIRSQWRRDTPELMAADASPARGLKRVLNAKGKIWRAKFNKLAPELAEYFAKNTNERVDRDLSRMLRQHGFTVKFKMTRTLNDVMQASIAEQVSLITSIPDQYMKDMEGAVMRSVSVGRDLHSLTQELEHNFGVARRRAEFIARDQNNKMTATLTRTRHLELGIRKAEWMHSHGGKKPRPSHVAANGKLYEVEKGMYLDGVWTWPGVEPNCRCVSLAVLPDIEDD